jgi:uncharacterized protein with FMN-binding domain
MAEEGTQMEAGTGKKKRRWLVVVIVVAAVIFVLLLAAGLYPLLFIRATNKVVVGRLDLSNVSDGTYEGEFKVYHVNGSVRVTVEDHRITKIENMGGSSNRKQVETALDEVVKEQSLDVDTISGATVSQKVALKAVEEALKGQEK